MFTSRLNRLNFFIGHVYLFIPIIVSILLYAIINFLWPVQDFNSGRNSLGVFVNIALFGVSALWIIAIIPLSVSLSVRRWHDVNQTGWLAVLSFIPAVSFVVFVVQLILPGTPGANAYGPVVSSQNPLDVMFARSK